MEIGSESKYTTGSNWRHIIYLLKCLFFPEESQAKRQRS